MVAGLKNFSVLLKSDDVFLVVELLADFSRLTLLESKNHGHTFTVLRTERAESLPDERLMEQLKRIYRRFPQWGKYPIAIVLDSRFASTIDGAVSVISKEAKKPITEADLDNLISQGVWKMCNRDQARVAKKLKIPPLSVALADCKVFRVRLDGHKVTSPVGFSARTVEFFLKHTYVPRKLAEDLKDIFPEERIFSIEEAGALWLRTIRRKISASNLLLLALHRNETTLYAAEDVSLRFLDRINWGGDHVLLTIQEALLIGRAQAQALMQRYLSKDMSLPLLRKLDALLSGEWAVLLQAIKARYPEETPPVYLLPFFNLPAGATAPAILKKMGITGPLHRIGGEWAGESFHCELKWKQSSELEPVFPLIIGSQQFYSRDSNDTMNKIAGRRVRWLVTTPEHR